MINQKRVKRIKTIIYVCIVLVFLLPGVLALALLIRVNSLESTLNTALAQAYTAPSGDTSLEDIRGEEYVLPSHGDLSVPEAALQGGEAPEAQPVPGTTGQNQPAAGDAVGAGDSTISGAPTAAGDYGSGAGGISGAAPEDGVLASPQGADGSAGYDQYPGMSFQGETGTLDSPSTGTGKTVYLAIRGVTAAQGQAILEVLNRYNAKATFLVGNQGTAFYRQVAKQGHAIGLEGYSDDMTAPGEDFGAGDALQGFAQRFDAVYAATGIMARIYYLPDNGTPQRQTALNQLAAELDARGFLRFLPSSSGTATGERQILEDLHRQMEGSGQPIVLLQGGADDAAKALEAFLSACIREEHTFVSMNENAMPVNF